MEFRPISNPDWQKQNGVSLLTAAGKVNAPFFLTMGDHLFESSILDQLMARADFARLNLAIDRKIDSIFDLDDAMKVQTRDDNLIERDREEARKLQRNRHWDIPLPRDRV